MGSGLHGIREMRLNMERNLEHYGRKQGVFFFAALLIILVLSDLFVCLFHHRNYKEKIEIIAYMINEEPEGNLDQAVRLLKNGQQDEEEGFLILQKYGYLEGTGNQYRKLLHRQYLQTIGISVVVFLFMGGLYFILEKKRQRQETEVLGEIEKALSQLMRNERKRGDRFQETDRISMRLAELSEYLHFMEEQAHNDREEIKTLITDISHQLKTPVAALETCLFVLEQEGLTKEEEEEFLLRAHAEMEGLKSLLDSLLQISKMESGMIQIKKEKAPIFDTILEAVNRIYPKAREKQMEILLEEEGENTSEAGDSAIGQTCVYQDKKWLCEALLNLLDNAVKYSPEESTVKILIGKSVSFLRISVQDEGIGISKTEYHSVFKRFYRGKEAQTKSKNGSGVGLYLAREIISMHQGTIAVFSNREKGKGEGCTFVVQIPL